jgi:hypothetical protein
MKTKSRLDELLSVFWFCLCFVLVTQTFGKAMKGGHTCRLSDVFQIELLSKNLDRRYEFVLNCKNLDKMLKATPQTVQIIKKSDEKSLPAIRYKFYA